MAVIAIFILAAVICIPVLLYFTRKPTKEKEVLQKQNDLKSEKETLGKENKGLQKNYESLKSEKERLVKEKEDLQKLNDRLKSENERLGKEKKDLQKQNETLKKEREKVEAQNKGLQKNYDRLKSKNDRLVKEKEDLQKKYESLKKEKKKVEAENKGLQKNYDHLKREKDALGKEKEALQKQNETLKQEKEKVEAEKEALQKNYDILESEKDALVKEKEALQKNYESLKKEREKVEAEKEVLQKQNDHLKREKDALGNEKEDLQKQNETLKQEKEKVEAEKEDLHKNYVILKKENERLGKDAFKKKNEMKTPTDNSKEGLEIKIKMLEEDLKDLQRNTNTCGYALGREWKTMTEARVNMTLDPDTASPSLTVSEDGSRVRFTGERSAEWPSVLGREGFTSGRHYWEVEVGEKGYWVLGVSTHTHEKSIPEKPGEGYWLVRLVKGKTYTAVSQSGDQILNLEKICKVWGVYLDHEGGKLSFYNVETRFHIHTLEGSFPEQVYPIFSPGSHDKGPLIIQRIQHTAANIK